MLGRAANAEIVARCATRNTTGARTVRGALSAVKPAIRNTIGARIVRNAPNAVKPVVTNTTGAKIARGALNAAKHMLAATTGARIASNVFGAARQENMHGMAASARIVKRHGTKAMTWMHSIRSVAGAGGLRHHR